MQLQENVTDTVNIRPIENRHVRKQRLILIWIRIKPYWIRILNSLKNVMISEE